MPATDQVTIVTGGGRGIGRAIAKRMARESAVLIVGQTRATLEATVAEITADGGTADWVMGDVSKWATAGAALDRAAERGWSIRNLVCNAGIGKSGATHLFEPDMFRRLFEVNVYGTQWFMQACLPQMIAAKRGCICIVSSIAAVKPHKYDGPYSATKAALNAMAAAAAGENRKHGVLIVPLCPGFVESDMTDRSIAGVARHKAISPEEARALIAAASPGGRILPAEEFADEVAKICASSDMALSGIPYLLPQEDRTEVKHEE